MQIRLAQTIPLEGEFYHNTIPAAGFQLPAIEALLTQNWHGLLKPIKNGAAIVYSTAIAHKLAAHLKLPVAQIASQIATVVRSHESFSSQNLLTIPLPCEIWDVAVVEIPDEGLIQFELGERAIAAWLDLLITHPPRFSPVPPAPALPAQTLFVLQHAHARCCSWLQLVHREVLIPGNNLDGSPLGWQLPEPIPWLTPEQTLRLDHPTERRLIRQLVLAMDAIAQTQNPCQTALSVALEVSQTFQEMHRHCPMLQDRTAIRRIYAQAGLILATQRVLRLLLEDGLSIAAPLEL